MKKIKVILIILAVLMVLLVVAALVVGSQLGNIVKSGMETFGPKITQTTLKVDAVTVSLLSGSAGVKGLVLGNPEGYQAPQSISVGNAAVSLVPGSVLSDKIVIRSIEVRAPEITFEGNPFGENNLNKIEANVNAMNPPANKPAPAAAAEKKPGKKLEVDKFSITDAKVHVRLAGKELTLTLPPIELTDLGKGPDGITAGDLTQKVLSQVTADTIKAVASEATKLGKDAANTAKDVLKDAGGSVDKLKKGVGGLFGK